MLCMIEQTRDEKIAMYLKLTKRELAEMLINCNDELSKRQVATTWVPLHMVPNN